MKRMVCLAFVLSFVALGFASANWPNEPAGTTLIDCAFDDPTCGGRLWDVYKGAKITQPGDATISPPNALVSSLIYPSLTGGLEMIYPAPNKGEEKPYREIYAGMRWRTNSGFEGNRPNGNKLFFLRAMNWTLGGTRTNGCWLMHGQANTFPHKIIFSHNTGGLDNSHACALDLGLTCYPNVTTTPIYPGQWYTMEAYVKASTCPTCRDGIVRWWVNGQLNGDYRNLNYGTNVVNEWVWAQTWDGSPQGNPCCATRDWHHYIDHLIIKAPSGVVDPSYVVINTGTMPTAQAGKPYSATLSASGGKTPYNWSITSGSLFPGLSLNAATGVISGTPTAGGKCTFTARVMDSNVPPIESSKQLSIVASTSIAVGRSSSDPNASLKIETAGGKVRFEMPAEGDRFVLSVYDLSGRWVYTAPMQHGEVRIAALKSGLYFAKLAGDKETKIVRFHVID